MADAIEAGQSLTDVAVKFRVPATALQRVIGPKRKTQRGRLTPEILEIAADRIRKGETFAKIADALDISLSVFTATMIKHGLTAKNLRPSPSAKFPLAITLYRDGVKMSEIVRRTGYKESTLYNHFHKHGVSRRVRSEKITPSL
jgi:hypothetical protein